MGVGGGAILGRLSLSNYHWLFCAFIKKTRRDESVCVCVCVTMWTTGVSVYGRKVFLRWVQLLERHFEIKLDWRCK